MPSFTETYRTSSPRSPWEEIEPARPKAGTPPKGTPLRSNDVEARADATYPLTRKLESPYV